MSTLAVSGDDPHVAELDDRLADRLTDRVPRLPSTPPPPVREDSTDTLAVRVRAGLSRGLCGACSISPAAPVTGTWMCAAGHPAGASCIARVFVAAT
ncbi:MAG: hypothetical protein ACHREM_06410 [Polyangiales bacterium]